MLHTDALFSSIRELTTVAIELSDDNQIERCLETLVERHRLLEELDEKLNKNGSLSYNSNSKKLYVELLIEIKKSDDLSLQSIVSKRAEAQQSIQQQSKKSKAISAYQKSLLG